MREFSSALSKSCNCQKEVRLLELILSLKDRGEKTPSTRMQRHLNKTNSKYNNQSKVLLAELQFNQNTDIF